MGAISNHYGDIITWIEKVIESCETSKQTITAHRLLRNFENRLVSEFQETYWPNQHYDIIRPLSLKLLDKKEEILKKELL
jgi:hypothetical protein